MITLENLTNYRNKLEAELTHLATIISKAPDAHLTRVQRKNGSEELYLHFHLPEQRFHNNYKRVYVNESLKAEAAQVAEKMHAEVLCKDISNRIEVIDALLNNFQTPYSSEELLYNNPWLAQLLKERQSEDERLLQWKEKAYERNWEYKENLIYSTIVPDLKVRSKSESLIVSRLEYYSIPYHYDEVLNLNGTRVSIDFRCLNVRTEKVWYWDHRGMMDNPDYVRKTLYCEKTFFNAGIFQGINLIVTSETKKNPLDILLVDEMIRIFLL